jgi:hypothetical protein
MSFCVAFSLRGVLLLLWLVLVDNIVFLLGVPFGSGLSFTKRSGQTRTNGHQGRTRAAVVGGWRQSAASAKRALLFGAQTALARTDSGRPVQRSFMRWAVHHSGTKWEESRAERYRGVLLR